MIKKKFAAAVLAGAGIMATDHDARGAIIPLASANNVTGALSSALVLNPLTRDYEGASANGIYQFDPATSAVSNVYNFNNYSGSQVEGLAIGSTGTRYFASNVGSDHNIGAFTTVDSALNATNTAFTTSVADVGYHVYNAPTLVGSTAYFLTKDGSGRGAGAVAGESNGNSSHRLFAPNNGTGSHPASGLTAGTVGASTVLLGTTTQNGNDSATEFYYSNNTTTIVTTLDGNALSAPAIDSVKDLYQFTVTGGANNLGQGEIIFHNGNLIGNAATPEISLSATTGYTPADALSQNAPLIDKNGDIAMLFSAGGLYGNGVVDIFDSNLNLVDQEAFTPVEGTPIGLTANFASNNFLDRTGNFYATTSNGIYSVAVTTSTPEPSLAAVGAVGIAGALLRRRRAPTPS